jgi:hypothetical protein
MWAMASKSQYYFNCDGTTVGPITRSQMLSAAKDGTIDRDTPVRKGTGGEWVRAGQVKGLFSFAIDSEDAPDGSCDLAPQPDCDDTAGISSHHAVDSSVGAVTGTFDSPQDNIDSGEHGCEIAASVEDHAGNSNRRRWMIVAAAATACLSIGILCVSFFGGASSDVAKGDNESAGTDNQPQRQDPVLTSGQELVSRATELPRSTGSGEATSEHSSGSEATSESTNASPAVPALATAASVEPSRAETTPRSLELIDLIATVETSVVRIDVSGDDFSAIGSGFVADESGLIVTNYHVMERATAGRVTFNDGRIIEIDGIDGILFADAKRDLAVVQCADARNWSVLPLAKELPKKGERVVAFGAPEGLDFTASEGIVSAIRSSDKFEDFNKTVEGTWIQTTTSISSGNSGSH